MATKSPLQTYNGLVDKLSIQDEAQLTLADRLIFINSQLEEMKRAMYRSMLDVVMSAALAEDDNELLAQKGQENVAKFTNDVRQFAKAIDTLIELKRELE